MLRTCVTGLVALFSLACLSGCTSSLSRQRLDDLLHAPSLRAARVGFSATSLTEKRLILGVDQEKLFIPASITKLFTSAVALELMGPDFRFETGLYSESPPVEGTIRGNLFIRGSGDPSLSVRFHDGGGGTILDAWADRLVAQGVHRIEGTIVGDGSLFQGGPLGRGWAWDDEPYCFSARISSLSLDDNCLSLTVAPGSHPGEKAHVTLKDPSASASVVTEALTARTDDETLIGFTRGTDANSIVVTGRVPLGAPPREYRVAVDNPALLTASRLKQALEGKNIIVTGGAADHTALRGGPSYDAFHLLAQYASPPLSDIIKHTNKASQNLYAELLFLTLGSRFGGEASAERAARVVRETLSRMGIDPHAVLIYDGSGLSRLNLATPAAVIEVLGYMYRHAHFRYFFESLPVAGVDGTLALRMRNTGAEGIVRAKTGTLAHVHNLAGYVEGRRGTMIAFAFMTNNYVGPGEKLKDLEDSICIMLSSFPE